jgi:hypothetical protein
MKGKRLIRLLVLPVVVMLWMIGWVMYSTGNNETEKESNAGRCTCKLVGASNAPETCLESIELEN